MKKLRLTLAALLAAFNLAAVILPAAQVGATVGLQDVKKDTCAHTGGTFNSGTHQCENVKSGVTQTIAKVVNILLFIIGIIAVVAIVIGGIMYATSGGNAEQTKRGKDTILYAIIGIIVAVMAYAIVGFITQNI